MQRASLTLRRENARHSNKELATRIALDVLRRAITEDTQSESVDDAEAETSTDKSESTIEYPDQATKAFAERLLTDPEPVPGEEAMFDVFGDIIKSGLALTQTVAKLAPVGLSILSSVVGESDLAADGDDQHLQDLTDRALLGQACLDALIESGPDDIDEALWDIVKDKFLRIGRAVISTSAQVIDATLPVIASSLKIQAGEAMGTNQSKDTFDNILDCLDALPASPRKLGKSLNMKTPAEGAHIGRSLALVAPVNDLRHEPRPYAGFNLDGILDLAGDPFSDAGQDGISWE